MKRLLLTLFLLITLPHLINGQVITTDPEFPVPDEPVTITFDATEGTGGLENHNGDIYAHTGVITDESTDNSDWKYIIADWGENLEKAKLTRVDTNVYELEITPSIRNYYGVPENEEIQQMAFVFRSSDGSKEGKAEGGKDIFAEAYDSSLNVKFLLPKENPSFYSYNSSVDITGITSSENDSTTELSLYIDGQQVEQVNNDTLEYNYSASKEGNFEFMLIGNSDTESDTVSQNLIINPEIKEQSRPQNLEDGIAYVNNSTVRFSLFAPHKDFVYVIGDFNNWQIQPEFFMHRETVNSDSSYFWIEIEGLNANTEYAFQYLVDGEIRVADPYSEKVLDEHNDPNIPGSIYPNLKSYPAGKTNHLAGVIQPGKEDYQWKNAQYDRPEQEELVTYELLIRDFLDQHNYQTLTDTLDYFKRLGVNAIELMPVMEFDNNSSWGYNPTFHLAADKYYGPAADLKAFIDAAHSRGIAVILDMVLNHAWGPSPLVRLWKKGDFGAPTIENPYLNTQPKHDFNVGYDFNHESPATQYYVDRVTEYWLEEFNFDGFRFDLSKGFTQNNTLGNTDAWNQYDASRVRILKRMADHIWTVDDSAYVILEHFADNSEEQELSEYGMMLWGNANHAYSEAAMGYHSSGGSDFSSVFHANRGWDNAHLFGYMESHDEERMMYRNLQYGNSSSDGSYDITELSTALERNKMAAAFFLTLPGPKLIWQFGELGYDISIDENGRTGEKPIHWDYYQNKERKKLFDTYSALLHLRKSHLAFTSIESEVDMDVSEAIKKMSITHPDMEAVIIGNFGVEPTDIQLEFSEEGSWYNYFSGDTLRIKNMEPTLSLDAGEFHIYTTEKFEQPEGNLLASASDEPDENEEPSPKFELHNNYPNPFSTITTIPFELPEKIENATLTIIDILGRKVQQYKIEAGQSELDFNGSDLSSGVYIYQLKTEFKIKSRKMLLIK